MALSLQEQSLPPAVIALQLPGWMLQLSGKVVQIHLRGLQSTASPAIVVVLGKNM